MLIGTFSYNVNVAKVFGIHTAAFISLLEMCRTMQISCGKSGKSVLLSRDTIYNITGLDDSKQEEVENALTGCGVLIIETPPTSGEKLRYILDDDMLSLVMQRGSYMCDIISPKVVIAPQKTRKVSKKQSQIDSLKKKVSFESEVVRQYFVDWIDAVYANPKGFLTEAALSIAEHDLISFSKDESVQGEVMRIAIKSGWRDLSWAIKAYTDTHKVNKNNFAKYSEIQSDGSQMSSEVF